MKPRMFCQCLQCKPCPTETLSERDLWVHTWPGYCRICGGSGEGLHTYKPSSKVITVNPAYTSQHCHACGYRAKKKLSDRWHHWPMCAIRLDRDTNAAINILHLAMNQSGITDCQVIPVEDPPFMHGE